MRDDIYSSISTLLRSDSTVSPEDRRLILQTCRRGVTRRKRLCTAKQAADLLACHVKTVYRYSERGLLHPIRYSARKVRFDLDEIERFVAGGIEAAIE